MQVLSHPQDLGRDTETTHVVGARGPLPKGETEKRQEAETRRQGPQSYSFVEVKTTCPRWLSATAKAEWKRMAPALISRGLLTGGDVAAFAAYCEAYADVQNSTAEIEGLTCTTVVNPTSGAIRMHPAYEARGRAMTQLLRFLSVFGLSPASRERLLTGRAPEGDSDDSFFG